MTLIAIFEDCATALSDCLITDEDGDSAAIRVPTIGSTEQLPKNIRFKPKYLIRKSHTILHCGSRATFLFSGWVSHFQEFVADLENRMVANSTTPIQSILIDCLREARDKRTDRFSVLQVIDGEVYAHGNLGSYHKNYEYFGKVYIAGSGAELLNFDLEQRGMQYAAKFLNDTPLQKSLRGLSSIPSIMIERDTRTESSTWEVGVGGYYETYGISEGFLQPIDHHLTLFMSLENFEAFGIVEVRRLFYHFYVNDWLFVVSLSGPKPGFKGQHNSFWRLSPGVPLSVPLSFFNISIIPPLHNQKAILGYSVTEMVAMLNSSLSYSLTTYRNWDGGESRKRFAGAKQFSELTVQVKDGLVIINIDKISLQDFAARHPATMRGDSVIIDRQS